MKNHFFFGYFGNKRQEVEKIYSHFIKLKNITHIIEPFCGSAALSYFISINEPKKYKYILNDNNNYLIELYKIARNNEELDNLIIRINCYVERIRNITSIKEQKEEYMKIIIIDNLETYIIKNTIYSIRAGLYPSDAKRLKTMLGLNFYDKLKKCDIIKFLQNEDITFTNGCGIKCLETYKNDVNNFIFLDPPYLESCNTYYLNPDVNIYEYLYNNNINEYNSNILLCLNDMWITRLLFKKNIKESYDKRYDSSNKKAKHIIIENEKQVGIILK